MKRKEKKSIYIATFTMHTYIVKALRHGSHSFICKLHHHACLVRTCCSHLCNVSLSPSSITWYRPCSAAGKVTAGLSESHGSPPPGGWLLSPAESAGWLPVHRNQLQAQRLVTSMGSLFKSPINVNGRLICSGKTSQASCSPIGRNNPFWCIALSSKYAFGCEKHWKP